MKINLKKLIPCSSVRLLIVAKIKKYVNTSNLQHIKKIAIFDKIDSTNTYLMALSRKLSFGCVDDVYVCLAEQQSSGKGRLGRSWVSPFAENIYLSLLWSFSKGIDGIMGMGLVVAISIVQTLEALGIEGIQLKWPNDVLWQRRKLAGVLIEAVSEAYGAKNAVIGIGLNVAMSKRSGSLIDQPWVDLLEITGKSCDRNEIAGLLIDNLMNNLRTFRLNGFKTFVQEWKKFDVCANAPVSVITPKGKISGIADGVDAEGRLRLKDQAGKVTLFSSGEVSLRF